MTFLDRFAAYIRQLFEKGDLRQEVAAAKCKITPQYFRKLLKRKSVPSLTVFLNICIAYHITPNEALQIDPVEFEELCAKRDQEDDWKPIKKSH